MSSLTAESMRRPTEAEMRAASANRSSASRGRPPLRATLPNSFRAEEWNDWMSRAMKTSSAARSQREASSRSPRFFAVIPRK